MKTVFKVTIEAPGVPSANFVKNALTRPGFWPYNAVAVIRTEVPDMIEVLEPVHDAEGEFVG